MFGSIQKTIVGWVIVGLVALLAIITIWWFVTEPGRQREIAARANAARISAEAQARANEAATKAIIAQGTIEQDIDKQTQENKDAIESQSDSGQNVRGNTTATTRRKLCERAAYRNDPSCK